MLWPQRPRRKAEEAARTIGLQILFFNASTADEIDVAFAALARERADALFVGGRCTSSLAGVCNLPRWRRAIGYPRAFVTREMVAAGGLMSYGTDIADMFRQVGIYTGRILKGEKPADLPVCNRPNSSSSSTCRPPSARPRRAANAARHAPTR